MIAHEPVYERPPEGLGRGKYAAPPWLIATLGGALLICTVLYFLWRARRSMRLRQAQRQSLPPSSRGPSSRRP